MSSEPTQSECSDKETPFSLEEFFTAFSDDRCIAEEMLAIFQEEVPGRLENIEEALQAGAWQRVKREAHSVANSAGILRAGDALRAARALERAAGAEDYGTAENELRSLKACTQAILRAIEAHSPA